MSSIQEKELASSNGICWWLEVPAPTAGFRLLNGYPFCVRLYPTDPSNEKISEIITGVPSTGGVYREVPVAIDRWSDVLFSAVAAGGIPVGYRVWVGSSDATGIAVP